MKVFTTVSLHFIAALLFASCGPSFRRTAQSDNAFLRCFDMDYNPGTSSDQKHTCWTRWLDEHVYNQPEDKIRYAELRLTELGEGISIPGPPGPPGSFDRRPEIAPSEEMVVSSVLPLESIDAGLLVQEDAGVLP